MHSISCQIMGFMMLVLGIYVLTSTKDAPPGCAAGLRTALGRTHKPEYHLCDVDEKVALSP